MAEVISRVVGTTANLDPHFGIDPLVLTSEQRASGHFKAKTIGGRELRVSMPRGTELQDGDVLCYDRTWAIAVAAAEEELLLLEPGSDPIMWAVACYQLGNLHRPARFLENGVLTPVDQMVVSQLTHLGIPFRLERRAFIGRRFGAAHGHHSHGHGHDHGHSHDHGQAQANEHDHDSHRHSHPHGRDKTAIGTGEGK